MKLLNPVFYIILALHKYMGPLMVTTIFYFYFFYYPRILNPLDWTNSSEPKGKPGKYPYGPKVIVLVDSTFDS